MKNSIKSKSEILEEKVKKLYAMQTKRVKTVSALAYSSDW